MNIVTKQTALAGLMCAMIALPCVAAGPSQNVHQQNEAMMGVGKQSGPPSTPMGGPDKQGMTMMSKDGGGKDGKDGKKGMTMMSKDGGGKDGKDGKKGMMMQGPAASQQMQQQQQMLQNQQMMQQREMMREQQMPVR